VLGLKGGPQLSGLFATSPFVFYGGVVSGMGKSRQRLAPASGEIGKQTRFSRGKSASFKERLHRVCYSSYEIS